MGHKLSFFFLVFRGFAGLFVFVGICFYLCVWFGFFKEQSVSEVLEGISKSSEQQLP